MPVKGGSAYTEAEITEALMALIAWAGNASAAVRMLKSEGKRAPTSVTLTEWARTVHLEHYDELRERYRGKLETNLAHEMRDRIRLAMEVERLALEKARERLKKNEDQDPGRTAANLATVAAKLTDKVMTLTSRPVQITETRDATEILRRLVAMGVLKAPDEEPKQIEQPAEAQAA